MDELAEHLEAWSSCVVKLGTLPPLSLGPNLGLTEPREPTGLRRSIKLRRSCVLVVSAFLGGRVPLIKMFPQKVWLYLERVQGGAAHFR